MQLRLKPWLILAAGITALPGLAAKPPKWRIPFEVRTLSNGLTIVVSEDHALPTVGVSVVYRVGMRLEPKGRTGFAHLFEHLMFKGTPNAPTGVFDRVIEGGGGTESASTHVDYTNYVSLAPVSALEPILWLEADRMKGLDFSPEGLKTEQEVVKEEIRVNVKNRPYGSFWLDLPAAAYSRWESNHDGYGSFEDLDHADLKDVEAFHKTYYVPSNAVLGVAGDVKAGEVFALAEKYFGGIPSRPKPAVPDLIEPLNTSESRIVRTDPLAKIPAMAMAWKAPERGSKDQAAAAILAEILAGGDASRIYQGLVKGKELLLEANLELNTLGTPWDYDGQTLFMFFAPYKPNADADKVLAVLDDIILDIQKHGVIQGELDRAKTKLISKFFSDLETPLGRADALARTQALWGKAEALNDIVGLIEGVASADLQRVASTYLTRPNRTLIDYHPAAAKN